MTKSYSVDIRKGQHDGALNRQWMMRPDDQRFTSLEALSDMVNQRYERCFSAVHKQRDLRMVVTDQGQGMALVAPFKSGERALIPTNWGFEQLCRKLGVGPKFLTDIPADLAVPVVNHYLERNGSEEVKLFGEVLENDRSKTLFKAANSKSYGRIFDKLLVDAVRQLVALDPKWKVPGTMNWSNHQHNPNVNVSKDNTTLYGSDRDVWLFLCQDADPVQIGVLDNGEPDWAFPGFYAWNSEVGAATLGIAMFWLRAVCMNRNLWGVQDKITVKIKHSKFALDRFIDEVQPMLSGLINKGSSKFVAAVTDAKNKIIAEDDDDRHKFLERFKFTKRQREKIINTCLIEEGHPMVTVFDAAQSVSAFARQVPFQDQRLTIEGVAEQVLLSAA